MKNYLCILYATSEIRKNYKFCFYQIIHIRYDEGPVSYTFSSKDPRFHWHKHFICLMLIFIRRDKTYYDMLLDVIEWSQKSDTDQRYTALKISNDRIMQIFAIHSKHISYHGARWFTKKKLDQKSDMLNIHLTFLKESVNPPIKYRLKNLNNPDRGLSSTASNHYRYFKP